MLCPRCGSETPDGADFCSNCGRALVDADKTGGPLLIWQADGGAPQTISLNRSVTIGRSGNNEIVVQETGISRQHARIELVGGEIAAVDLGSLNGTFVNDERIEEPRSLQDGDLIRVGSHVFTAVLPDPDEMQEARTVSLQPPTSRERIDTADDEEAGQPTMYVSDPAEASQQLADERAVLQGAEEAELVEAEAESGVFADADSGAQPYLTEGEVHPDLRQEELVEPEDIIALEEPEELSGEDERTVMAPPSGGIQELLGGAASHETALPSDVSQEPTPAGYLVHGETRIPLYSSLSVGRAEGVDYRIDDDRTVSRNHAHIEVRSDGSVWLVDNASANGTFLENEKITGAVPLERDANIKFGATAFRFETIPAAAAAPEVAQDISREADTGTATGGQTQPIGAMRRDLDSSATFEAVPSDEKTLKGDTLAGSDMPRRGAPMSPEGGGATPDQYRLIVNFGADAGMAFALTGDAAVIGRVSPDADYEIRLNDRAVSRPHAKILRTGNGFSIQDLDSANGTWLNYTDEVTDLRPLTDGDIIKTGKTTLLYRVPASIRPMHEDVVLDPNLGQILTTFSLKGGVGTTMLAVNLAVLLRRLTAQPVLLIDLATEQGAVGVHMNLAPKVTLADLPSDPATIELYMLQSMMTHHPSGVDVLAAPPSPQSAELVSPASVSAALPVLKSHYRWIVTDTSAAFSELNLGILDQSDLLLLTFAPDVSSLKVMQSTLDVLSALQTPAEKRVLVLNQVYPKAYLQPSDIENTLGERIGLTLPYADETLLGAIDKGIPLAIDSAVHPTVTAIEAFASKLAQINIDAAAQPQRGGFGRWVQGVVSGLRR
jgi:pSer/pThr/pTyr-binding forkhead associated (FHA) protein